jgi:hypothetical protein
MYERSYGYKYEEGGKLDTAAIAKLIRREIKAASPRGPAARALDLLGRTWTGSAAAARSTSREGLRGCLDAVPRLQGRHAPRLPGRRLDATGCGNPWCKAGGEHKDKPGARSTRC